MDERVLQWEEGLPGLDDLTPLSQSLIPPELLSAFSITAEPPRTVVDVNRASKNTLTSIRGQLSPFEDLNHNYSNNNNNYKSFGEEEQNPINLDDEDTPINNNNDNNNNNYDTSINNISVSNDDIGSSKSSKRPRLVWTPQLHKRFVDVVGHLGIKNAVPKMIMQLMNVEGLTRENVASHLQKYRLYLKRMQGLSDEGPSASDHLFASTPVPQSLRESTGKQQSNGNGHVGMMNPMSDPPTLPQMMHMPYIGMMAHGNGYHGYEAQHQFGSFLQYHNHVAPNDN